MYEVNIGDNNVSIIHTNNTVVVSQIPVEVINATSLIPQDIFQKLNLYVNMKSGITNIENSNSKLFFASYQFNDFKDSFFGISDLHLMNIIAVDTIKRMKDIGKKMRFASKIAVDDINLESTQ